MKKLIQAQVTLVFADVDDDGEIGDMAQPVQLSLSGKEWKTNWATSHSDDVFNSIRAQLEADKPLGGFESA